MDQLFATFGINWKLLVTQGVNFAVLLAALSYFLYKPLIKTIDDRRRTIADGVRTAEAASQRLADAQQESEKLVGEGARTAEELVSSARVRAEEKAGTIVNSATEKASAILRDAEKQAEEAKQRALAESQKEITKAAMLAAEKILAKH